MNETVVVDDGGIKQILITGGAGFIGSHCLIEFIQSGYEVIVVDNFSNSSEECLKRVEMLVGRPIIYYAVDINDYKALDEIFKKHKIFAVLHLAGYKSVGVSIHKSLEYYQNNICGTLNILTIMQAHGVFSMIFASSATVYGLPKQLSISEEHPVSGVDIKSPYGKSKYMIEHILSDLCKADKRWNVIVLRYFNPVGAHKSGQIGEDPVKQPPPNLMAFMSQVAVGRYPFVSINGSDYDTPDGTGLRDYIHICDLAEAHVLAVRSIDRKPGYNGERRSVLEMVKYMQEASGKKIECKLLSRRDGDVAVLVSDPTLAQKELGWKITRSIQDMCVDLWRFQSNNPNGYSKSIGIKCNSSSEL